MFMVGVYILLGLSVPQPNCPIISARHNEPAIGGEASAPHPVTVTTESELELLPIDGPHLREGGRAAGKRREEEVRDGGRQ